MDKKAIRTIVIIFAAYFIISSIIFYNLYMMRSKSVWSFYFDEVKDSQILNEEFGKVQKVKMNNFLNWSSKRKGYTCIKMKITTNKGKYSICKVHSENEYKYIVNNKVYQDTYSIQYFNILNNKSEDFYKDLKEYFVNNLKTDQDRLKYSRLIKQDNNSFEFTTSCNYNEVDKCIDKNKEYLDEIINSIGKDYSYETIDDIKIIS